MKEENVRTVPFPKFGMGILALLVLAPITACGNSGPPAPTPAEIAAFGRFCSLVKDFRTSASASQAAQTPSEFGGPPESFTRLVEQLGPLLDEWVTVAPAELGDSVRVVVDSVRRAKDADVSGVQAPAFRDAIQRIDRFDQSRCQQKMIDDTSTQ